jgi:hypothetical protein
VAVYGQQAKLGDDGKSVWPPADAPAGNVHDAFLRQCWITSPGQVLLRTDALRQVKGFRRDVSGADDWEVYLRLAVIGSFCFAPRIALWYRRHDLNASNDKWKMYSSCMRVVRIHLGWIPAPRHMRTWRTARGWAANLYLRPLLPEVGQLIRRGSYLPALCLGTQLALRRPDWLFKPSVIGEALGRNVREVAGETRSVAARL